MKNQLLLLEDVEGLGRSGDIVTVKPGYARNFLFPKKKAVLAEKHTIRLQEKLKEERAKKAAADRAEAESIAKKLEGQIITTKVKVDAQGHLYGSVANSDVAHLCKEQLKLEIDKKNVLILKAIKKLGVHEVEIRLKEGVPAHISLEIHPEEA